MVLPIRRRDLRGLCRPWSGRAPGPVPPGEDADGRHRFVTRPIHLGPDYLSRDWQVVVSMPEEMVVAPLTDFTPGLSPGDVGGVSGGSFSFRTLRSGGLSGPSNRFHAATPQDRRG